MNIVESKITKSIAKLERANGLQSAGYKYCVGLTEHLNRTAIGIRAGNKFNYFCVSMTKSKAQRALRKLGVDFTGNHLEFSS